MLSIIHRRSHFSTNYSVSFPSKKHLQLQQKTLFYWICWNGRTSLLSFYQILFRDDHILKSMGTCVDAYNFSICCQCHDSLFAKICMWDLLVQYFVFTVSVGACHGLLENVSLIVLSLTFVMLPTHERNFSFHVIKLITIDFFFEVSLIFRMWRIYTYTLRELNAVEIKFILKDFEDKVWQLPLIQS